MSYIYILIAPQLKISDDRLSVIGEKGYSMGRATNGKFSFRFSKYKIVWFGCRSSILKWFSVIFLFLV